MSKLFKIENSDMYEKFNINEDYANNYNNWRQKEELHKLKARYGKDLDLSFKSSDESTESSEDNGEEISEQLEQNFYKTLAYLKNKDPKIYDKNVQFFIKSEDNLNNKKQLKDKTEKSLFLRDYERKIIIERGGKFSDGEVENDEVDNVSSDLTYAQEQLEIKDSFKKVLQNNDDKVTEDVLFKLKVKTNTEIQKEEKDYKEWLRGQNKNINKEEQKVLKPLRDFWSDPNLDENEKFLRDYILDKKFLNKKSEDLELNYEHGIHDSDENLSEDEHNINRQEEFEHKFNFRFEEPDQEFIKRYPRTVENSLRKKDTRRSQKRAEIKIRKEQEKIKKQEELKQLKALKKKEIEDKLEKLKEVTGNDDLKFSKLDLDEDFNPDEYDKKMSKIFNDEYYTNYKDDVKPEFPDIDIELNIESTWDNYDPVQEEQLHCDDAEFNMDADYDDHKKMENKSIQTIKGRKKKRRSKFAEMIAKKKPKFDPTQYSSYKQYYDQYYALDYEDIIGDLPCRFKYRQVVPNDYGLSIEEILMADDRELNKWCPLKKAFEHKSHYKELNDVKMFKQKASNKALKRKILKSLFNTDERNKCLAENKKLNQEDTKKKQKYNKKRKEFLEEEKIIEIKDTKYNINVTNLIDNSSELNKSIIEENKQIPELKESLKEIKNLKLEPKKKKLNNIVQNKYVENKPYLDQSQTFDKIMFKNNKKYTDHTGKVNKSDNLQLKKSSNGKIGSSKCLSFLSTERLKAYGLNPKKFKNKLKYGKQN